MIREDLIIHFLGGFFLATCLQFSLIVMILSVVLMAVGKEFYDKYKGGIFDWKDMVLTLTGGFAAFWITLVYKH